MVKKITHIRRSREFIEVFDAGKREKGSGVTVYFLETPAEKGFSVGVTIPKKVIPLAVDRNRIRRVIYACFSDPGEKKGMSVKVVVKVTMAEEYASNRKRSQKIKEELKRLLKKTGILC
ncbi:MAG: ribonuclease P protein component [Candidatus Omnitrophica bacterium]|nr:ribonuclease P protein component [Candidatus Omnitrophota bacterium]MDD5488719.1 ribonuclease P protein component [Candidatus Omnitrophota bacterium]